MSNGPDSLPFGPQLIAIKKAMSKANHDEYERQLATADPAARQVHDDCRRATDAQPGKSVEVAVRVGGESRVLGQLVCSEETFDNYAKAAVGALSILRAGGWQANAKFADDGAFIIRVEGHPDD